MWPICKRSPTVYDLGTENTMKTEMILGTLLNCDEAMWEGVQEDDGVLCPSWGLDDLEGWRCLCS